MIFLLTGTVFSIEELAIHDGPGVRTTVFLKGCPLRCMWCHSPEGQEFSPELIKSPNGCLRCGACLRVGEEKTGRPVLVDESISVCPMHLIRTVGERYTPEEMVKRLLRNADFLNRSGGGVTFSGGEALAQPAFLKACLSRLCGKLHRAIQTSGFASREVFDSILADCDYVLYDLKLIDPSLHYQYCGQDNAFILENYKTLTKSGKEFITRIPLIPTITDTEENLTAIAALMRECGVRRAELLPYHRLTGSKYAITGRVYSPLFDETLTPQAHAEIFHIHEIEVTIL